MQINVCLSPALYSYYSTDNTIAVVIDVFRATTSICTAFHNGAKAIKTVASLEEAKQLKSLGHLVVAERNTQKCDFADFSNSPFDFTPEKVKDKLIVFTTTNGTQAVEQAINADEIIIGAFSNLTSVAKYCTEKGKNILLLCSGWNNRFCIEDTLCAGALIEKLSKSKEFKFDSDDAQMALQFWKNAKPDVLSYISKTEHYRRLKKNGFEDSVPYCISQDTVRLVPVYNKKSGLFVINPTE